MPLNILPAMHKPGSVEPFALELASKCLSALILRESVSCNIALSTPRQPGQPPLPDAIPRGGDLMTGGTALYVPNAVTLKVGRLPSTGPPCESKPTQAPRRLGSIEQQDLAE